MVIYYLVDDYLTLSWGTAIIYFHVAELRRHGYDARVLHQRAPFRPAWLEYDIPIHHLDEPGFTATSEDVVVVPEVLVAEESVQRFPWRKIVFVQGSFLIFRGLKSHAGYRELGFERAMAILPHVAHAVERHFRIPATVVPPFIAPYFFAPPIEPRQKRILFPMKHGYDALGIPDQEIAKRLLEREFAARPDWQFVPLESFDHREVAELMRSSMLLVNVFSHEAFNTTVPEAMAAGCVVVCYEAGGGRDFLEPGENAIVFPNQHVWALIERVCDLADRADAHAQLFEKLRTGGRATAARFTPERTSDALLGFMSAL
ncbi:MAG: glycosyltransferase [Acidobacteriota bacterium]|nr:glycosyltransferase [Acidobacteriota bacterium]